MIFYARVSGTNKQTVEQHSENVAALTEKHCQFFGPDNTAKIVGRTLGLGHDIGKYGEDFQNKLLHDPAKKVIHSSAGAYLLVKQAENKREALLGGLPILGHHTLLDVKRAHERLKNEKDIINKQLEHMPKEYKEKIPRITVPKWVQTELDFELFLRMMYSTLVDADRLDAEHFSQGPRKQYTLENCLEQLENYISNLPSSSTPIGEYRKELLKECKNAASSSGGAFFVEADTGSGKTLSSMMFALVNALKYGRRRVIYVVPYTSIADQISAIFRNIFGEEKVLEHQSNIDLDQFADNNKGRYIQAFENWDMPIIVTTQVQFFESLLGYSSGKCRKIHNISNSVVVFDEAHKIPDTHFSAVISIINQLVRHYNVTTLLMTGTRSWAASTQPYKNSRGQDIPVIEALNTIKVSTQIPHRVVMKYLNPNKQTSNYEVAKKISEFSQAMCIVNRKDDARDIAEQLSTRTEKKVFHLSTHMCSAHRSQTIAEIKTYLEQGLPCYLVATSLIEAGVDISFPVGFRELAGIDSLIQAAGRINRHGELKCGFLYVYEGEQKPPKGLNAYFSAAKNIFKHYNYQFNLFNTTILDEYNMAVVDKLGGGNIQQSRKVWDYPETAKRAKMIEDDAYTVVVPYGNMIEILEQIKSHPNGGTKDTWRKLRQFFVPVSSYVFRQIKDKLIQFDDSKIWVLDSVDLYSNKYGLGFSV